MEKGEEIQIFSLSLSQRWADKRRGRGGEGRGGGGGGGEGRGGGGGGRGGGGGGGGGGGEEEEDHPSCRNSKQPPSPGFNLHWEEARRAPGGGGGGWSALSAARQLCQRGQSGGHLPPHPPHQDVLCL